MIEQFGTTAHGEAVQKITIGDGPLTAAILTVGAALQDVRLESVPHSLTVGSPDLAAYEGPMCHCGTIMGPVANRIENASAEIDGTTYHFEKNFLGRHTLHSGSAGTHLKVWTLADHGPSHATLTLTLEDGDGGFPGTRHLTTRFSVQDTTLTLTLDAETDAPTLMNLANHSYWTLGPGPTTRGHILTIRADRYLPSDDVTTLPTGAVAEVANTRFDYRHGRKLEDGAEGLLDTNFCLSDTRQPLRTIATLAAPGGVTMTMASTEPGLQVFDGHILDYPNPRTTRGTAPVPYAGLALEAQFWPNAPANPHFPDITLRPGEPWQQITTWSFQA